MRRACCSAGTVSASPGSSSVTRSQTAGERPGRDQDTHDNVAEMGVTKMPAALRKIQTSETVRLLQKQ